MPAKAQEEDSSAARKSVDKERRRLKVKEVDRDSDEDVQVSLLEYVCRHNRIHSALSELARLLPAHLSSGM